MKYKSLKKKKLSGEQNSVVKEQLLWQFWTRFYETFKVDVGPWGCSGGG